MLSSLYTVGVLFGITILFILLFTYLHRKAKRKSQSFQNSKFNALVKEHRLSVTEKETIGHYCIAIDNLNAKLLYIDFDNPEPVSSIIDLRQVKNARIASEEKSIYEEKKGRQVFLEKQLTKLELELIFNFPGESSKLPFFQLHKEGLQQFTSFKTRAEYWQALINNYIHHLIPVSQQTRV